MLMTEKQYAGAILGLANQIKRAFNISSGKFGVQIRILDFILSAYPNREIYQKDIEEELNITGATVSGILKRMEAQKLIYRETVSYDERLKKILPTLHTSEMKEQIHLDISSLEEHLTAGIGEKELDIFLDVLQSMQKNMERQLNIPYMMEKSLTAEESIGTIK